MAQSIVKRGSVMSIRYPFTDLTGAKVRPALVVTPDHLLGRVISSMIFLTVLIAPLGSLLGGALAEWTGLRTTLWITAGSGVMLGLLLMRISPLAALRSLPHPNP